MEYLELLRSPTNAYGLPGRGKAKSTLSEITGSLACTMRHDRTRASSLLQPGPARTRRSLQLIGVLGS